MRYGCLLILILLYACGQSKKYHDEQISLPAVTSAKVVHILEYQKEQNDLFKDPEKSPLPDRHRKHFEGLEFFPPDTTYIVEALLERTPDAKPFLMPSTTGEKTEEVVFGILRFTLNGTSHELEVYRSLGMVNVPGYKDYLFLPFYDLTNGEGTYGGGRYLDLRIPEGDRLEVDFNRAYNPYCVYNKKYSCPLVPRQNFLNTKVTAGVRDFVPKK